MSWQFFRDFFGRESIPHFQFSTQFYRLSFEPDQPIVSPVVAVILEIRVLDESHEEQHPNFSFPISDLHFCFSFG